MSNKSKFYSTKQIDDIKKTKYMFILGERSSGKSYALKVKALALENYADHGGRKEYE